MKKPLCIPVLVQGGCSSSLDLINAGPAIRAECDKKGYSVEFFEANADGFPPLPVTAGDVVLVLAFSRFFLEKALTELLELGAHPLVLGLSPENEACSFISFDRAQAVRSLISYFTDCGRQKTALFGINPLSVSDTERKDVFVGIKGKDAEKDIFYNNGSLMTAADLFCKSAAAYDSVICANDMAAVLLRKCLTAGGIKVPEDIYIAGSGNTAIARFAALTSISLDYAKIGEMSVSLFEFLSDMPVGVFAKVKATGTIFPRRSTNSVPPGIPTAVPYPAVTAAAPTGFNFVNDQNVIEIDALNQMLSDCDDINLSLLGHLQRGSTYEQTADLLHIGLSTLRYRLGRICQTVGVAGKSELMERLLFYGIDLGGQAR